MAGCTGAVRSVEGEKDQGGAGGGYVVNGRRIHVSASNLAEAIVAEQEKKERIEQRKRDNAEGLVEPTRKPRLIGLPRALRAKATSTAAAGVATRTASAAPRSNAEFAAMFKKNKADVAGVN